MRDVQDRCRAGTRRGFTLIELLVVIAIIAILAAILFPVFARARSQARKIACTSNMKQMALATMMYVQDYDETFPPRYGAQSTGLPSWIITIQPYAKNQKIGSCPEQNSEAERKYLSSYSWMGYGMNTNLWVNVGSPMATLASVPFPAETMMQADSTFDDLYARPRRRTRIAFANSTDGSPYTLPCADIRTRHGSGTGIDMNSGGSNVSYADGHVKFHTASAIMFQIGITPTAVKPGDPLFYEGLREQICVGGPTIGP
jgi:prepilin-type N-terminal cleavage/methylation domain-containing protein/prepilin-type processing-associated H-X9-DG protein